jgi:anti-sigma factor RsiW
MNCEKCQELLSDLLDGDIGADDRRTLDSHLEECVTCLSVRNDLDSIVSFCRDHRGEYDAPPNERALWLRIRNIVESERRDPALAGLAAASGGRASRWPRWIGRSWELSFTQLVTAVAAIVVAVSLFTAISLRSVQRPGDSAALAPEDRGTTGTTETTAHVDDRALLQQQAIDYWRQRVEQKKVRWTPGMRETFERNMNVYEQAVEESRRQLKQNPHDEISEEMLHAALNDKMELLKEFSDQ